METSNLSLAHVVEELKQFVEGSFINSVQLLKESVFKIRLHSKEHGTIELIATPNALYKTSYKLPAQQQQTGFAAFLKKQLYNKRVLSMEQHGFDRIIEMHFADFELVFELFARGNVVLKDKQGKIIACYHSEQWRDREIKRGAIYKFPATKPSISEISEADFKKIMEESPQDCVRAIVSALNVAPIAAEEACLLARTKKEEKANSLSKMQSSALLKALKGLYSIGKKKLAPVVVEAVGEAQLLPFAFKAVRAEKAKKFHSINEALDENITAEFLKSEGEELGKETEKKKSKLEYSRSEQFKAKERLEKEAVESRQKAELIYAHYSEIKELVSAINSALEKGMPKKDIMYKIKIAGEKGNKPAGLLLDLDPKTRKIVLGLPSN